MGRRKAAQLRRTAEAAGWLDVATALPGDGELAVHLGSVRTQPAVASLAEPHRERITRWWRQGAAGAVARVAALGDDLRVGERLLSRAGKRDDGVGAEADVGGIAVEAYPLGPGFGEAAVGCRLDKQAQAMSASSIAVPAGDVDGVEEGGGESSGAFRGVPCYHFRYHNNEKHARIDGKRQETKTGYLSFC